MHSRLQVAIAFSFLGVLLGACGSALGPGYNPPYVTILGVVTSSEVATPEQLRVALVWQSFRDGPWAVAQELGVRAEFPARFKIDVTELPPEEAMVVGPDDSRSIAAGTIVVYEDGNGNGVLDLLSSDAQEPIDRVFGVPVDVTISYVEGTPLAAAEDGGFALSRGFSLIRTTAQPYEVPAPGPLTCVPVLLNKNELLPISTEISIVLSAKPELSQYMCRRGMIVEVQATSGACASPEVCPYTPPPSDAEITCSADKRAYTYKYCTPQKLCENDVACDYGCYALKDGEPLPAEWPCP